MNKSLRNSIFIKFKNTMFSASIKLTLLIGFTLSLIVSFFPFFQDFVLGNREIKIATNMDSAVFESLDIDYSIVEDDDYDIKADFEDGKFNLKIKSNKGNDSKEIIKQMLMNNNIYAYMSANNIDINEFENAVSGNIEINDSRDSINIDDDTKVFLMYLTIIFYLVMVLLVSRIGASVAFEKGNKVTEIILTSISKKQLYFSQVLASCFVIIISFVVISIPMVCAYIVNDPKITSNFDIFSFKKICLFLVHLITVSISLVISSIGMASLTKRVEDANAVSIFSLIPLLISYLYYVIQCDLYRGAFYVLNYIPYFSAYPVFGAILSDSLSTANGIIICCVNIVFTIVTYFVFRKVYCNKISRD